MAKKSAESESQDDQVWPLAPDVEQPEPGQCVAAYDHARLVSRFKDRLTIELHYTIVIPEKWLDFPVVLYCSSPLVGPQGKRSKYFDLWCLANGGPPKRRDRMRPSIFNGYWLIEIGHTRRRMTSDGIRELNSTDTPMTVIVRLIERVAAGGSK